MKISQLILSLILLSSCAGHRIIHPPAQEYLASLKTNLESSTANSSQDYAASFLKAKSFQAAGNNNMACEYYEELASEKEFPLNQLSFIRMLQTCELSVRQLERTWDDPDLEISGWLKREYVETSYSLAKRNKMFKFLAHFASQLTRFKKRRSEKEALQHEAIAAAKLADLDSEELARYESQLYKIAPRLNTHLDKENTYAVARDFEGKRKFDQARELYNKIINEDYPAKVKVKAWHRIPMTYKLQRKLEDYTSKTKEMAGHLKQVWQKQTSVGPEKGIYESAWVVTIIKQARAEWTQNRPVVAAKILRQLLKSKSPTATQFAQVYWLLGSIELENKSHKKALKHYQKALTYKIEDRKLNDRLTWSLGWNRYLLGDYKRAVKAFEKYKDEPKGHFERQKRHYWLSKSHLKLKNKKKALQLQKELIENDPYGYYGALARRDLKQKFDPIAKITRDQKAPYILEFEWLAAMGEHERAKDFLSKYKRKFKTTSEKEAALGLYGRINWYEGGVHQFFRIPSNKRQDVLTRAASIAYPSPYQEAIAPAAKRFKLPESLFLAIIRQESAFNPVARSWADAFGLMQMIPERAKVLADLYKVPYKGNPEELFEPEINISLGGALLSELSKKFKGEFIPMICSYNASEKAVANWRKHRFDGDPVKFIEMIPYEETKGYIKLVIRNFLMFERLSSDKSFLFDEKLLAMKL